MVGIFIVIYETFSVKISKKEMRGRFFMLRVITYLFKTFYLHIEEIVREKWKGV